MHIETVIIALLLGLSAPRDFGQDVTIDDFPPLDEMYHEDSNSWSWPVIHMRCAGVYLLTQWVSQDDPSVTNRFIDKGEYHVIAAARHMSRDVQLDFDRAYGDTMEGANRSGLRYLELAESEAGPNGGPLAVSVIAADLKFCDQVPKPESFGR